MRGRSLMESKEGVRRKLRALAAVVEDPSATKPEKVNAEALRARLEQRLRKAGAPAGDWTDKAFRLGSSASKVAKSTAPAAPKGDWTDNALRLGKVLRRGYRKWLAQ